MGTLERGRTSARDALVCTTIEHLARYGPVGAQPQDVCAELGISKALVNYHFGGREGLIAEAVTVAYETRSKDMAEMARSVQLGAPATEVLEALIESQVRWGVEHPGLAAATAYPDLAVGRGTMTTDQLARLRAADDQNFASVHTVVVAARLELTDGTPFEGEHEARMMSAVIGWMTLGMLVWSGGTCLPTQGIEEHMGFDIARQHLHVLIRESLTR